jgi:hypothetical protein
MNGIDQMPDVAIELPCGNVLLSEITPELLIAQASGYSRIYPPEYKSYVDPILFDSYSVHIDNREGQLMYGFIVSHQKILRVEFIYHAVLWDRKNIKRYIFPITYDQAVELFGEPDKAYNYHRVRL